MQVLLGCCNLTLQEKGGRGLIASERPRTGVSMLEDDGGLGAVKPWQRAERVRRKPWLKDLLVILAACTACSDCMPVLLKCKVGEGKGLLAALLDLLMAGADSRDVEAVRAVLDFLIALARVEAGQAALTCVKGLLNTVTHAREALLDDAEVRSRCARLLHNLAFAAEAKPHILASPTSMAALLDDLHASAGANCRAHAAKVSAGMCETVNVCAGSLRRVGLRVARTRTNTRRRSGLSSTTTKRPKPW